MTTSFSVSWFSVAQKCDATTHINSIGRWCFDIPFQDDALINSIAYFQKRFEQQKKGKRRMRQVGNIEVPQSAFLAVLKLD